MLLNNSVARCVEPPMPAMHAVEIPNREHRPRRERAQPIQPFANLHAESIRSIHGHPNQRRAKADKRSWQAMSDFLAEVLA
jgi:hypothetical protein